jgi:iron complex outermembrane receptor protein
MKRLRLLLPLLPGLAFSAESATAPTDVSRNLADLSLEELMEMPVETVLGASKYVQQVTRAPSSVSVVTAEDIRRFGYRTLTDVFRALRGVYVSDDRNYSYVGVRGFMRPSDYNTRVLMLVDGHRMNDNVYDSVDLGYGGAVSIDMIDRVELVRGPSSSIYGDNAFFGIINVITRQVHSLEGTEISASAGSLESFDGRLSHAGELGDGGRFGLSISGHSSAGHRKLYYPEFDQNRSDSPAARHDGIASHGDGEQAAGIVGTFREGELNFTGSFAWRSKDVPTASYGTLFDDGAEHTIDSRGYLDVTYDHELDASTRVLVRAYVDHVRYMGTYPFDGRDEGFDLDRVLQPDMGEGQWAGTEWQLTRHFEGGNTLLAGVEYRQDFRAHQHAWFETDPPVDNGLSNQHGHNAAAFVQAELNVTSQLLLNAGARFDYYFERFGGTVNPRVAAIYSPRETTQVKAMFGTAFRSASAYEQDYDFGSSVQPELSPERIRTYELALDQYFHKNYRVGLSVYHYHVSDLITQVTDPEGAAYFDNVSRVHATGVELELEARYLSGLQARLSYARQRAWDELTGVVLTNSPRELVQGSVTWSLLDERLLVGAELQYHASVTTLANARAEDFTLANFTVTHRVLGGNLEFSGGVYNLFDQQYGSPGSEDHVQDVLTQDGRAFRLRVTRKF